MSHPYVHIDLDKPRKLRFRHNDLADLEVTSGKGIAELMSGMSFHGIRLLLCYGLRWQDAKMTPSKAGELAQAWIEKGLGVEQLVEKILDALRASGFLKANDGDEPAEDAEGNGSPDAA